MRPHDLRVLQGLFGFDVVARFRSMTPFLANSDGEVLKLFAPKSVRRLGGAVGERVVSGYLGFAILPGWSPSGGSALQEVPEKLAVCPIENFPWLVGFGFPPAEGFADRLHALLKLIPNSQTELRTRLGSDFFLGDQLQRTVGLAKWLRREWGAIARPDA